MKPQQFKIRTVGRGSRYNAFTTTGTKPAKTATINVDTSAWATQGMKVMIGNKLFRVLSIPGNRAMKVRPI